MWMLERIETLKSGFIDCRRISIMIYIHLVPVAVW